MGNRAGEARVKALSQRTRMDGTKAKALPRGREDTPPRNNLRQEDRQSTALSRGEVVAARPKMQPKRLAAKSAGAPKKAMPGEAANGDGEVYSYTYTEEEEEAKVRDPVAATPAVEKEE